MKTLILTQATKNILDNLTIEYVYPKFKRNKEHVQKYKIDTNKIVKIGGLNFPGFCLVSQAGHKTNACVTFINIMKVIRNGSILHELVPGYFVKIQTAV